MILLNNNDKDEINKSLISLKKEQSQYTDEIIKKEVKKINNKIDNIDTSGGNSPTTVTVNVGSTTTGAAGTSANVTNSGDDVNVVLDFTIPRGQQGTIGNTPNITAIAHGLPPTSDPTVTKSGTNENPNFDFGIPKGQKGDRGVIGPTPNISVDSSTLIPGSSATVSKSGTNENPKFTFGIPRGDVGPAPVCYSYPGNPKVIFETKAKFNIYIENHLALRTLRISFMPWINDILVGDVIIEDVSVKNQTLSGGQATYKNAYLYFKVDSFDIISANEKEFSCYCLGGIIDGDKGDRGPSSKTVGFTPTQIPWCWDDVWEDRFSKAGEDINVVVGQFYSFSIGDVITFPFNVKSSQTGQMTQYFLAVCIESFDVNDNHNVTIHGKTAYYVGRGPRGYTGPAGKDGQDGTTIIPSGFIYVQFPNQKEPEELFPNSGRWDPVTSYNGAFFRASGGDALSFGGGLQNEGLPNITGGVEIDRLGTYNAGSNPTGISGAFKNSLLSTNYWGAGSGGSSTRSVNLDFNASKSSPIYGRSNHVTPKNYTVKIWKKR